MRILLLHLLLLVPGIAVAEVYDLIIVSGQSNAVGYDAYGKDFVAEDGDKDVPFWFRCGDPPPDKHDVVSGAWTHLKVQPKGKPMPKGKMKRQYGNYKHASGGFGPEVGMARRLQAEEDARPVAVLKVALSGTRIAEWQEGGTCYTALTNELARATAAAKERGMTLEPRAFVWVQGESDANPKDAPKYVERMTALVKQIRRDSDTPELIALLGVNERFGNGKKKEMPDVIKAQQDVADALAQCARVDTSEAAIANGAHWNVQGPLDAGRWFAEALLKLEKE